MLDTEQISDKMFEAQFSESPFADHYNKLLMSVSVQDCISENMRISDGVMKLAFKCLTELEELGKCPNEMKFDLKNRSISFLNEDEELVIDENFVDQYYRVKQLNRIEKALAFLENKKNS